MSLRLLLHTIVLRLSGALEKRLLSKKAKALPWKNKTHFWRSPPNATVDTSQYTEIPSVMYHSNEKNIFCHICLLWRWKESSFQHRGFKIKNTFFTSNCTCHINSPWKLLHNSFTFQQHTPSEPKAEKHSLDAHSDFTSTSLLFLISPLIDHMLFPNEKFLHWLKRFIA